jgi:hypothetical protein
MCDRTSGFFLFRVLIFDKSESFPSATLHCGMASLVNAVMVGNHKKVIELLAEGADPNQVRFADFAFAQRCSPTNMAMQRCTMQQPMETCKLQRFC